MDPYKTVQRVAMVAPLAVLASTVHAVATSDVTFRILPGEYMHADAASLLQSGNDSVSDIDGIFGDDPWSLLDKTDESPNEFNGVTFILEAATGATSGTWDLSWSQTGSPGLPLNMDFVFVSKASANWAAYLFESVNFTADPLTGDGTFQISWTTGNAPVPPTPGLSHASIYGRTTAIDPDPDPVPAPATILLMALGLLGLRISGRVR